MSSKSWWKIATDSRLQCQLNYTLEKGKSKDHPQECRLENAPKKHSETILCECTQARIKINLKQINEKHNTKFIINKMKSNYLVVGL